MLAVLILAAGRSTRMGRSKPLLPHGTATGQTFVSHLVQVVRTAGISDIYVIGRPDDTELRAEVEKVAATFIQNPRPDEGQLSSLQAGLSAAEDVAGGGLTAVMVMPADVPLLGVRSVDRLLAAAGASTATILRATHGGRHGHPVIFKRPMFAELHAADPAVGARAVVHADPARVEDVEVEDAGVTIDVDTPDDYVRAFGRPPGPVRNDRR
ncbi:MAG: nucleotidyltransferase family protein [Vicinamibacterales bacterium]